MESTEWLALKQIACAADGGGQEKSGGCEALLQELLQASKVPGAKSGFRKSCCCGWCRRFATFLELAVPSQGVEGDLSPVRDREWIPRCQRSQKEDSNEQGVKTDGFQGEFLKREKGKGLFN